MFRLEGKHYILKGWIGSFTGDLLYIWQAICNVLVLNSDSS